MLSPTLEKIVERFAAQQVAVNLSESDKALYLGKIFVRAKDRGIGIGSSFMREICAYADRAKKQIALTPSADFGGSVTRLKVFYKKFAFVENKGRNKDFSFRETFYRNPK